MTFWFKEEFQNKNFYDKENALILKASTMTHLILASLAFKTKRFDYNSNSQSTARSNHSKDINGHDIIIPIASTCHLCRQKIAKTFMSKKVLQIVVQKKISTRHAQIWFLSPMSNIYDAHTLSLWPPNTSPHDTTLYDTNTRHMSKPAMQLRHGTTDFDY